MNLLHQAIPANEERGRPAVQILPLWQAIVQVVRRTHEQHRVRNSVLRYKGAQTFRILQLIGFLEREIDYFQTARVELVVQLHQKRRFVVAVRAPAAADRYDHHLAAELVIRVADSGSCEVRTREAERLGRVFQRRLLCAGRRRRQLRFACVCRTAGDVAFRGIAQVGHL